MARTKGMLNLSGNLEVNAGAPLDARSVVPTVADLTVAANFQYKYIGMTVVVQATGDMYVLTANDVTVAANWKQIGSGSGGSSYTAGDGIDITNDEISVKAGSNLSFDSSGNLNATNTTYTAGDGIVIDNDEISTDNMPAADMSEIVTPLPSVMSRLPRYSTEEQIVAYWIDGKPLYQRSFSATTTANQQNTIASGLSNIDNLISMYGTIHYNNTSWVPLSYVASGSDLATMYLGNGELYTMGKYGGLTVITIQYTKTTD